MKNIRNMGQGILTNTVSFDSQTEYQSQDDNEDVMSQASHRTEESNINNQSLISYVDHANHKSDIGENHIKLNIAFNALLVLATVLLFSSNWYMHEETIYDEMHPDGRHVQFWFSILSVTIEPTSTQMSITDFQENCEILSKQYGSTESVCFIVNNFSRCFIVLIVMLLLQVLCNTHSIISMMCAIRQDASANAVSNDPDNS